MRRTDGTRRGLTADAAELMDEIAGIARVQILYTLAQLNIPDRLADGPRTAQQVAERQGTHPRATYRLMRAAASIGVLSYEGEGRFGLTGRGRLLRSDAPGSLHSLVLTQASPAYMLSWGMLPDAVRRGTSRITDVLGAGMLDYLAQPENAEEVTTFAETMSDISNIVTRGAVAAVDLTGVSSIVDVGGGDGHFVLELVAVEPRLHGYVLDLPHVVERALAEAAWRGQSKRLTVVAGDFFRHVPAADLYLLKNVLHDWGDRQCEMILRNCRASANRGARAFVVETVVGEVGTPDFATLSDITMLAVSDGGERTVEEFDALFAASGWRRDKSFSVGAGYSGIEINAV